MVNHQVVNGETVEGNKGLKHTCQSSPKTEENSATGGFNSEEMEKLRNLLGSLDNLLELVLWLFQVSETYSSLYPNGSKPQVGRS
ncbi:hypothetical protein CK203_021455 [Vitis vinifera]|uniref:Uncharacterized protein n=1 Tax=Vitis vinifera TaxID=29760 RepID=A0A438ISE1_VITVI|nr:hypothetical protein CK203_021455 [Vitis vinifera]